jgi:HD-like signal output (HDOD) protein
MKDGLYPMSAIIETFEQKLKRAYRAIQGIKIPDLPEEVIELDHEMNARYPNTQKMVQIISKNTVLAGEVLVVANSPAMRAKQPISSIAQAVSCLGTQNLKNMVVAAALRHIWGGANAMREIIDNSADVAYCAAELANFVQGVTPDEVYVCGLFHNGGAILLSNRDSKLYGEIFFQSHSLPLSSITKEEEAFNTNHTVVGMLMGKKWHLSDDMIQAIYYHHVDKCSRIKDEKVRLLVALLKVANGVVAETSIGAYIGAEMNEYMKDGIDTLMLDTQHIKDVRMSLQSYSMGFA